MGSESKEEEIFRLLIETNSISERIKTLLSEGIVIPIEEEAESDD